MANPKGVISDAFENLKRSISEEDAHEFASTTLKDVWFAVRHIDSEQRKRQSAQNLRRIEPLLKGIEKYAKVIEVLCNGTPFMPYVWAPIKLMLQLASNHRDVFEELLTAYADIGNALPRFDRYEKAFRENIEFQNVLATVYSSILEFHQRAYKFFRRRAWSLIFLSLWKDFRSRFDSIVESLQKQRDFVDREAISIDIVESKESRNRAQEEIQQKQRKDIENLENAEKNRRISHLQHSVAWLTIDETIQEAELERISSRRHDKTSEWIMKEPRIKAWLKDDTQNMLLWLNGKPGAGKSVICSYIIQSLERTAGQAVSYFFCNSQDLGNVFHQILKTITLQLLRHSPELSSLIANEFIYRGLSSGIAQLKTLIPQLLQIIPKTRIIIDGIDECSHETQKVILKDLYTVCIHPEISCKILLSSRREVFIQKQLLDKPQILLDGRQEVDLDIRSYVMYKIMEIPTENMDLLDRIESILVEKANGMFLWVRLVINELRYCYSDAALEERAMSLPKGLKAAYGRILDRIMDDNNSEYAKSMAIKILEWLACSHRVLKIYEVLDGIAFQPGSTTLDNSTQLRREVLDLCRPLIEDGPSNTVDFVHFSAKEYVLQEEYRDRVSFLRVLNAHLNISFSCITYLNTSLCLLPSNSTDESRIGTVIQGFHGLQLYANKYWYKHLLKYCELQDIRPAQFSQELLQQLDLLLRFQKKSREEVGFEKKNNERNSADQSLGLEVLDHLPEIKSIISDVIAFRVKQDRNESSDKDPDKISLDACVADPTHFSATRHYYQLTTEYLLNDKAVLNFPGLDGSYLQAFREIYGCSAFVCRYLHCALSTAGFDSLVQRDRHESQHRRRFRCSHFSCAYFMIGFASKLLLNRHNEKWHPSVAVGASLADAITTLQKKLKGKQNNPDQLPPMNQRVEKLPTTVRENESRTELAEDLGQDPESAIETGLKSLLTSSPNPYLMAPHAPPTDPYTTGLLDLFPWSANGEHPENQISESVIRQGYYDKRQMTEKETGSAISSVKPTLKDSGLLQESLLSVFTSIRAQRDALGDVLISNSNVFTTPFFYDNSVTSALL